MRKPIPHVGKCRHCNANVWFVPIFEQNGVKFIKWSCVNSLNKKHVCFNMKVISS